jgi:nitrate reductase molybdenum cofactor assembly chaperone NarJ/NarW
MVAKLIDERERQALQSFVPILNYPDHRLLEAVRGCETLIPPDRAQARLLLADFRRFVEVTPLSEMEEIYTSTFDLEAACHPYIGYHLFGESYKRSAFLVELTGLYLKNGIAAEKELPDHLGQMLRFLAVCDEGALADELIHEALLPALDKMFGENEDSGNPSGGADCEPSPPESSLNKMRSVQPYKWVLQALKLLLEETPMNGSHSFGSMDANE